MLYEHKSKGVAKCAYGLKIVLADDGENYMVKRLTKSQFLGEAGESAVKTRFLEMGFQFDGRSRLETGIDAFAEITIDGEPQARMIAVQIKTTERGKYTGEDDEGFAYLLNSTDIEYWQRANVPVIIVLHRVSDKSFYWKDVASGVGKNSRKLEFSKADDILDQKAVGKLTALTIPKHGAGYYIPPLGGGEQALVNILPVKFPEEIFVASTPYNRKQAAAVLFDVTDAPRFDWVIKEHSFWSFQDPREAVTKHIVDIDQVDAVDTALLALHEDIHEQNNFAFLLKKTLSHQFRDELGWDNIRKLFYFLANEKNKSRMFTYMSTQKNASTTVVNVHMQEKDPKQVAYVRHHAFIPRFEILGEQWNLVITPTYYFTRDGFIPHSYPDALLSGKKRLDKNAAIRGQIIMWQRMLSYKRNEVVDLFGKGASEKPVMEFGELPELHLSKVVPEKDWDARNKAKNSVNRQGDLLKNAV